MQISLVNFDTNLNFRIEEGQTRSLWRAIILV